MHDKVWGFDILSSLDTKGNVILQPMRQRFILIFFLVAKVKVNLKVKTENNGARGTK